MRFILILLLLCGTSLAAEPVAKPAMPAKADIAVEAKQVAKRPARKQVLMVVRATQQKAANEAAVKVLGPYARNTFSVECRKGSTAYYVSACQLTDEQETAIRAVLSKLSGTKPQVLAAGKEYHGKAKAELKRQSFSLKKGVANGRTR